ncbi:MAG TPA: SDR family NAD(P)-dependent oxidoreductase [Acetobacteraceae bacterium]|jgi:NADP-dependent 3-hydroxy acid dehydrogenase YdfG|nr:SDR family NAD(P)-dependent oxidoreductase [Acetobacteraceae bacterium]
MWKKRVLVAGASGDIGYAVTKALHEAGAQVFMLGRQRDNLARRTLPETGAKPVLLAADLTSPSDIERVQAELQQHQPLHAIVMSSGVYTRSADVGIFRMQMENNVIGPYALLRRVVPCLVEGEGDVVFINSSQALRASANVGQYAATKHAMRAIADSLREEVNELGVRVTSIYLGRTAGETQREIAAIEERPYRPEYLIQPADVGNLVRYVLQSPRTAEITDISMRPTRKG